MATEQTVLARVRALLARFEAEMDRPEGLVHLNEALSLLSDIQTQDGRQVAINLTDAYAKKVQGRVEPLVSLEPPVHWDIVEHWIKVFDEFESFDFVLPQEVVETRSKFIKKKLNREYRLMSPAEREAFLKCALGTKQ